MGGNSLFCKPEAVHSDAKLWVMVCLFRGFCFGELFMIKGARHCGDKPKVGMPL
jgi:hypothetical protein